MDFNDTVLKYLTNLTKTGEDIAGFVEDEMELKLLLAELEEIGYSFSIRTSTREQGNEESKTLYFNYKGGVPFFGHPFMVLKSTILQCIVGPKYYKKKPKPCAIDNYSSGIKKRRNSRGTKKQDCPATLLIKKIKCFPQFTISIEELNKTTLIKKIYTKLKEQLKSEKPESKEMFYITFSGTHSHQPLPTLSNQILDSQVEVEIEIEYVEDFPTTPDISQSQNDPEPQLELKQELITIRDMCRKATYATYSVSPDLADAKQLLEVKQLLWTVVDKLDAMTEKSSDNGLPVLTNTDIPGGKPCERPDGSKDHEYCYKKEILSSPQKKKRKIKKEQP